MDFHSHLCRHEIIGFLGGTWDPRTKCLTVKRALPARRLVLGAPGENASVEVELDPESVPDIVEALDRDGLRVVGWYHSHPVFSTHPSLRDIENQSNYQRLFRDDEAKGGGTPFVGAIVGPCATTNKDLSSDVRWFHVAPRGDTAGDASEPTNSGPFELRCDRGRVGVDGRRRVASRGERLGGCIRGDASSLGGTGRGETRRPGHGAGDRRRRHSWRRGGNDGPPSARASPTRARTGSICVGTGATERPGWRSWREASSPGCRARGRMSYATGTSAASSSTFVRRGTSRRTRRERRDD